MTDTLKRHGEKGVTVLESLMTLSLFSTVALSIAYASITHLNTRAGFVRRSISEQLAMETLEDYAQTDPQFLFDDSDVNETGIVRDGMSFSRAVDVTVTTNRTRNIVVTVTNDVTGSSLTFTSSLALWDKR